MRKLLFFICLFIFFISCGKKNKVPPGILSKDKMEAVLWDQLRAGEFLEGFVFKDTTIDKAGKASDWYDHIYKLHQITKEEFDKSYKYYKEHPSLMKEVLDSLSKKTMPIEGSDSTVQDSSQKPISDSAQKVPVDSIGRKDSIARASSLINVNRDRFRRLDSIRGNKRLPVK